MLPLFTLCNSSKWRSNIVFLCIGQLNVADGEFQESIFRTAIERGRVALLLNNVNNGDDNVEESATPPPPPTTTKKTMLGQIPKQMSMQVGGIASHKSMVLKLDQYILKPFGTTVTAEESAKKKKQQQQQVQDDTISTPPQDDDTTKGIKEEDVTKIFRGVREMAFYEAIEFANSLSYSSYEDVKYKLEVLIQDKYKLYTLSSVVSSIWSCRYPCTGHVIQNEETNVTKMYYSIDAIMLLMAYFTGDSAVNRSIESYTMAWYMLIKEMYALKKLRNLTSPYFGVVDSETLGQQQQPHQHPSPPESSMMMQRPHLLLQNLTAQFRKPNIIDIKMGTQTYEPTAPHTKQQKEISKYIHQLEFGFRIVGMGVHQSSSGEYKYWDKKYGVSLTTMDEVTNALSTFFRCNDEAVIANKKRGSDSHQHISNTLSVVIDKLNQIKEWFEVDNPSLAFYASSILIVYEGDFSQGDEKVISINNEEPVVKIIDFAHVCRQTGTDLGYITGVRNLINIVEGLRSKTF
jgi:hypothetical protein